MQRIPRRLFLVLAALATPAWLASPAPAAVPGSVNFQGLLLDDQGDPVTGTVDLVLRLYDAEEAGTLLWTETHDGIEVLDGVYQLELGSTTPLTAGILDTATLYLEVEVEGDTLAPRQRLLAVPYALRAGSADNVATLSAAYVTQLIEHVNLDGGGPPNLDASEGLADPDGDGIANFVDPDNDGDGLSDIVEVAQGSDINVVTPTITGFDPSTADGFVTTQVEVQGTNFIAPLAVSFGSETPTPSNVTSTSFDVDVGPQAEGSASVQVTNANGEVATSSFDFFLVAPVVTGFDPASASPATTTTVTVEGSGFLPGLTASFGSLSPTPMNVTSTSFEVDLGPNPGGEEIVPVSVTNPNGKVDASASFSFLDQTRFVFVTSSTRGGAMGGVAGGDAECQAIIGAEAGAEYIAWLGDGTTDPASRFPQNAGPFELADGTVIADDWADLTDGSLDAPLDQDQSGVVVQSAIAVWTGVDTDGSSLAQHCNGWTSDVVSDTGRTGQLDQTDADWTADGTSGCSTGRRLYCFQRTARDLSRRVFVTSAVTGSSLGSVAGADAVCAAAAAGLHGTFLAWIGDGTTDPADRFAQAKGPYVLMNGTVVADDWADLVDGTLDAPINRTVNNAVVSGAFVWTGVEPDGTSSAGGGAANCDAWTNPFQTGRVGRIDETDADWSSSITSVCQSTARLYCFEQ